MGVEAPFQSISIEESRSCIFGLPDWQIVSLWDIRFASGHSDVLIANKNHSGWVAYFFFFFSFYFFGREVVKYSWWRVRLAWLCKG